MHAPKKLDYRRESLDECRKMLYFVNCLSGRLNQKSIFIRYFHSSDKKNTDMTNPFKSFCTFFLLITSLSLYAQSDDAPVKYLDALNNEHGQIINKNMEYIQHAVHNDNWEAVEEKRQEVIAQIEASQKKIGALPPYEEDAKMRDEMLEVLKMYHNSFKIEFNEVNLLKRDSKESYEAMEKYFEAQDAGEKKLAEAAKRFEAAMGAFAKNHNIRLLSNQENSEIDQLNRLNAYHRKVFLKTFRISKTNNAFMEAMNNKEKEEMRKLRTTLIQDAEADLKILKAMPDFNGDIDFRNAAIEMVEFYRDLATNGYKVLVEVNSKEQSELTQKDVDSFNKVISTYNAQIPNIQARYNQAASLLMRKNVPKPRVIKRV